MNQPAPEKAAQPEACPRCGSPSKRGTNRPINAPSLVCAHPWHDALPQPERPDVVPGQCSECGQKGFHAVYCSHRQSGHDALPVEPQAQRATAGSWYREPAAEPAPGVQPALNCELQYTNQPSVTGVQQTAEQAKVLKAFADFVHGIFCAEEEGLPDWGKAHNKSLAIVIGEILDPQDNVPLVQALDSYAKAHAAASPVENAELKAKIVELEREYDKQEKAWKNANHSNQVAYVKRVAELTRERDQAREALRTAGREHCADPKWAVPPSEDAPLTQREEARIRMEAEERGAVVVYGEDAPAMIGGTVEFERETDGRWRCCNICDNDWPCHLHPEPAAQPSEKEAKDK